MTLSTAHARAVPRTSAAGRRRRPATEVLVFWTGTGVGMLHALDDAVLHRQPGVGIGAHVVGLLLALALACAAAAVFPVTRPGVRAGLAVVVGVLTLVNGLTHVEHVLMSGPSACDLSGVLAAAAGVILISLGLSIPWRHGDLRSPAVARWARRAFAVVSGAVVTLAFLVPVGTALLQTHLPRHPIGDPPSPAYTAVTFPSSDGLRLSGWYRPSRNRAAVVLVHGGGSDRTGSVVHAELLARNGYGVLLYDARGSGQSDGSPNGFGWGWSHDVSGALTFLSHQNDVDPGRIGALGLSTGATALLEVAAHDNRLAAVIADGAAGRSYADRLPSQGPDLRAPYLWSMYAAARVFSGTAPAAPLDQLMTQVAPTPLFLVAGGQAPYEPEFARRFARAYDDTGNGQARIWVAAGVHHTAAVHERPTAYARKVVDFLGDSLLS